LQPVLGVELALGYPEPVDEDPAPYVVEAPLDVVVAELAEPEVVLAPALVVTAADVVVTAAGEVVVVLADVVVGAAEEVVVVVTAPRGGAYQLAGASPRHSPTVTAFLPLVLITSRIWGTRVVTVFS